jgi:hypothetical protein
MCIAQENIHIENKRRDLLNHAGDGDIGTESLCKLHIAATTGLQVTGVRRSIDGANVQNDVVSRLPQCFSQLISDVAEPTLLIRLRSINCALQTSVEQFEVKCGDLERLGIPRRADPEHQRGDKYGNSHHRGRKFIVQVLSYLGLLPIGARSYGLLRLTLLSEAGMIPLFIGPEALSTPVTNAIAADPVKIGIGYLQIGGLKQTPSVMLKQPPENDGVARARLPIEDDNTRLKFLRQRFSDDQVNLNQDACNAPVALAERISILSLPVLLLTRSGGCRKQSRCLTTCAS